MGEQDLDQRAGASSISTGSPGGIPVRLMRRGKNTPGLRLGERGRPGQPSRLGPEDLEVMIQGKDFDIAAHGPFVAGDQHWAIEDFDGPRSQTHRQSSTGIASWDRIEALPHRHPCPIVYPRFQVPRRVERLNG